MTYFLLDLASCTTVHEALGSARSVWQPADERVTAVSKTVHITLLLPVSGVLCLESVMSDNVCVCVHRQFSTQAGFPNRFICVFCTSLRYFRRISMHYLSI